MEKAASWGGEDDDKGESESGGVTPCSLLGKEETSSSSSFLVEVADSHAPALVTTDATETDAKEVAVADPGLGASFVVSFSDDEVALDA